MSCSQNLVQFGHFRTLALILTALLSGCGDPSESTMKTVIQERIGAQPVCWSLENNITSWPVRLTPSFISNIHADPVLSAMSRSGYLTIMQSGGGMTSLPVDVVTPTPEAQKWWTDKGFYVGHRVVSKMLNGKTYIKLQYRSGEILLET